MYKKRISDEQSCKFISNSQWEHKKFPTNLPKESKVIDQNNTAR